MYEEMLELIGYDTYLSWRPGFEKDDYLLSDYDDVAEGR